MIPLSRPILPGELWWSVIARHAALLGLTAPVTRQLLLAGNKRSLGSPLFPRQLDLLVARLEMPLSATEVIEAHTMLPYYAPFVRAKKLRRAVENMKNNGHAEFSLGLAPMEDYPVRLKLCPACFKTDVSTHGAALWHRVHQAPGVLVCVHHFCALRMTIVSARVGSQIADFVAAEEVKPLPSTRVPSECRSDLKWIAFAAQSLLESNRARPGPERLTALYRRALASKNLMTGFDRICLSPFVEEFSLRFKVLFAIAGCTKPNPNTRDNWLARLVRYPECEQSPLKHLLLMRFLGLELPAALEEADALPPIARSIPRPGPTAKRTVRITPAKAAAKRAMWLQMLVHHLHGSPRKRADALYCWLWRNERSWLRRHTRRNQ